MIVILIWSLNLIFNKMAFLVLSCVYTGSFLIRGFFSSLTPTPAYTWALIGRRTYQGWMRAEILYYWWEENRLGKRWALVLAYPERGVGEESSSALTSLSACCLKEGVLTPSLGKAPYCNQGDESG